MAKGATKIIMTPPMTANFTCLNEPDTYEGTSRYQVKLRASDKDPAVIAFMKAQKALALELGIAKVTAATNLLMKPILDEDGEKTGEVQIIAKSNYKPLFVKKNGKPYEVEPKVGDTSTLVAKLKVGTYEKGLSSVMEAIQVVVHVVGTGSGGKASADGFTSYGDAEDDEDEGTGFSDQSDDDADDNGGVDV